MRIERNYCGLTDALDIDCHRPVMPEAPIPLCEKHMRIAYLHFADHIGNRWRHIDEQDQQAFAKNGIPPAWPKHTGGPVVYYALVGHRIKIGHTRVLKHRMGILQPDELLALEPGGIELERKRLKQFAQWRRKGKEYFHPGPDLRAHIENLRAPKLD